MNVRWMIRSDLPRVLEIERLCFQYPWNEADFLKVLRVRSVIGMVVALQDELLGYMIYDLKKSSIKLLSIAVDPCVIGTGVGYEMIKKLKTKLHDRRIEVQVSVRESNTYALRWLARQGFKAVEFARRPYVETDEDAIIMKFRRYVISNGERA